MPWDHPLQQGAIGVTGSPKKVLGLTGLDRVFEQVERPDELPAD